MEDDKGFLKMSTAQVIGYVAVTIVYIVLIGILMLKLSPWWFVALFIWDWKWNKVNPTS